MGEYARRVGGGRAIARKTLQLERVAKSGNRFPHETRNRGKTLGG
jgi:hypothetical protein